MQPQAADAAAIVQAALPVPPPMEAGQVALVVALFVALAALLSAVRLTLARASRPEPQRSEREAVPPPPPVRARVLGALLVGNVLLNTAAAVVAATHLARLFAEEGGEGTMAASILALTTAVILAEALARLAVRRGLVEAAFLRVGIRLDRYAQKLTAREEIRDRIDLLRHDGEVVKTERDMLGGLLDLGELTVEEVMVHRTRMRTIDAALPRDALIREVLASPHTRLPVWRERPDGIIGVLHAKDLFRAIAGERPGLDIETVLSPPWFVPATTSLRDQLAAFLARKQHFALVVDEYGDLMGLVTLEDILEEIVGDIADEHDVAARGVRPQPDGSFLVDGSVAIRDLNRMMDWQIPDEEATTIAGLVIHEAQAIPEAGQAFTFHGFRFEVLRRVRNRIAALRVSRLEPGAETARGPQAAA
jgi:Mg2+/Co2+ transporter CorB